MITYVILTPGDVPVGYIRSDGPPTLEAMADHLTTVGGFDDRDHLMLVNPNLTLGYCALQ